MRRQGCETQSFLHSPAAGAPPNSLSLGFSRFANAPRTPLRPEAANAMLNPQWELPTRADHPLAPKVEPPAALLERAGVPPAVSLLPRGLSESFPPSQQRHRQVLAWRQQQKLKHSDCAP
ncbi:hypothetical protein cyc_07970, partial [Cyclospora cayetanensis]